MLRWLLFLLVLAGCGLSGSVSESSFEAEELEQTKIELRALIDAGNADVDVYYNLGHVYFALGEVPSAVGYWRVSHALAPRDGEISHNLAMARTGLREAAAPVNPVVPWAELITHDELGIFGLLLLGSSIVLLRTGRRTWGAALLLVGLMIGQHASHVRLTMINEPLCVVTDNDVELREAPRIDARRLAELGLGSEVRIVSVEAGFALVVGGEQLRGWVPLNHLQVVPIR
jgi:hypothetical protein